MIILTRRLPEASTRGAKLVARIVHRYRLTGILAALIVSVNAHDVWSADQPLWGQRYSRNMVSSEVDLPEEFDPRTGRNVKWSIPLGTISYSTPVVANGRIFIGTNNENPRDPKHRGDRGVLLCLDEKDGHLHWQLVVPKLTERADDWSRVGIVSTATA